MESGPVENQIHSKLADKSDTPAQVRLSALAFAAAATASGKLTELRGALSFALGNNVAVSDLYETLLQTYLFAGYPRAINALAELSRLEPRPSPSGVDLLTSNQEANWIHRGTALCRRVYGVKYDALLDLMGGISPELGRWMVIEGYGKVLSRESLSPPVRELVAVASLCPLDVPDQLRAHLRGALLVGATEAEIRWVLETAALLEPDALEGSLHLLESALEEVGA